MSTSDVAMIEEEIQKIFATVSVPVHDTVHDTTQVHTQAYSTLTASSPHFPPVSHNWSSNSTDTSVTLNKNRILRQLHLKSAMDSTLDETNPTRKYTDGRRSKPWKTLLHTMWKKKQSVEKKPFPSPVILKQNHSRDEVTVRVFAKRPIETVNSLERFRRTLMRKIVLYALSVRYDVDHCGCIELYCTVL
jgi:hypothetical protein